MAVPTVGASASNSPAFIPSHLRLAHDTRARRSHGVFLLGDELASVHSSRRQADHLAVTIAIGSGSLVLTSSMTPLQARAMARGLLSAAAAAERSQGDAA